MIYRLERSKEVMNQVCPISMHRFFFLYLLLPFFSFTCCYLFLFLSFSCAHKSNRSFKKSEKDFNASEPVEVQNLTESYFRSVLHTTVVINLFFSSSNSPQISLKKIKRESITHHHIIKK